MEVRYDILFDILKVSIYPHSITSRYDKLSPAPEAKLENERRAGATKCGLNLSSNAEQLEIKIELKLKIEFQI